MMDIRHPIGWLFLVIGALLVGAGLADAPAAARAGWNVDAAWGAVMAAFGTGMLLLAWRHRRQAAAQRR